MEIVEELIGNPKFCKVMKYAPERVYADKEGNVQVINEMWTGSWWWEIQVSMHRKVAKSSSKLTNTLESSSKRNYNHTSDYIL